MIIMSKRINLKQTIFLIAVLALIALSLLALNAEFLRIAHTESDDDIFGSGLHPLMVYFVLGYLLPYAVSLVVIIYNGLYSLKSTPFTKAKRLHCIAFGINLATILLYILMYVKENAQNLLSVSIPIFFPALVAVCASIVIGSLGTRLHKREQKRQLKSADSQKTE